MEGKTNSFEELTLPKTRLAISDMLHEGQRKHMVHGLMEVDVTTPRKQILDHKQMTGEMLSFTAFITNCLAKAVDENKIMHGYRKGRNRLVLFDEVDVNTQIEREVEGRKWVMPYIIRAANQKTFLEIHQEIRQAQKSEVVEGREFKQYDWYLMLPGFVRRVFWWVLRKSPELTKNIAGTVGVTSLGMFGDGNFWGIPITTQTLLLTVGGIAEKPGVKENRIDNREYLSLTMSFDHDIIDGAPAARFASRLKELIESSHGLN